MMNMMPTVNSIWHPRNMCHMCVWFRHLAWSHYLAWHSHGRRGGRERDNVNTSKNAKKMVIFTSIVTGATSGIGYEIAKELAISSSHVVLLCRTAASAKAALKTMRKEVPGASVEYFVVDLANPESVLKFTREYMQKQEGRESPPLKLLVNNAGVYSARISYTRKYHLEQTFASNLFGHYILMEELAPLLRSTKGAIVSVSSFSHRAVSPSQFHLWLQEVHMPQGRRGREPEARSASSRLYPALAYACTKLAMVLLSGHKRSADETYRGITLVCLDPGAINTRITRNWPPLLSCVYAAVMKQIGLFNEGEKVAASLLEAVKQESSIRDSSSSPYLFGEQAVPLDTSRLSKDKDLALQLEARMDMLRKKLTA